jgi:hypothetical protein
VRRCSEELTARTQLTFPEAARPSPEIHLSLTSSASRFSAQDHIKYSTHLGKDSQAFEYFNMARGNQRDKAREANQKKMADQVSAAHKDLCIMRKYLANHNLQLQKKGNAMSGSEMQREKEKVAAKMREKQAAGKSV